MDFRPLIESAKLLGLEGDKLREYVEKEKLLIIEREERAKEREERAKDRDMKKVELELKLKEEEMKVRLKESETEMEKIRKAESLSAIAGSKEDKISAKMPKLPNFDEGKDDIDSYLQRFERFATSMKWGKNTWATTLSAYLKGTALSVFSRMTAAEALDYDKLKVALLKRFQMTEEGFRTKFRVSSAQSGETVSQYSVRLESYLERWVELGTVPKTYDGLRDLMIREQIINTVSKSLALYLRERNPKSVKEMVDLADLYNEAHQGVSQNPIGQPGVKLCFICRGRHLARDCPSKREKVGAMVGGGRYEHGRDFSSRGNHFSGRGGRGSRGNGQIRYSGVTSSSYGPDKQKGKDIAGLCKLEDCCTDADKVRLQCGHALPLMSAACNKTLQFQKPSNMPLCNGQVSGTPVTVLRDTGCSSVVVKATHVRESDYTGEYKCCVLIDGTVRKYPVAVVLVETPYYTGAVDALVMENPVYELIIGNIEGVKDEDTGRGCQETYMNKEEDVKKDQELENVGQKSDEIKAEEAHAVQTRAQERAEKQKIKPLKVPLGMLDVDKNDIAESQQNDQSLSNIRQAVNRGDRSTYPNGSEVWYEVEKKLIYRRYKRSNGLGMFTQLVVPNQYREHVLKMGHDNLMSGHLGMKKTTDRILAEFYWPGIWADIRRYCQSCSICQRTFPKGKVTQLPIGDMPIIDTPFKRVAIDLVGPINPPSERGHRFILTVVDYASRYPEAVALKKIDTETVAEALLDMFSRVGLPQEILTDLGKQFVSDLMKEICRLLSINKLTTTPYHPQCNGLVERFNGVLKSMLRKMTEEEPKQWDRFIPALLFAYRDSEQESLGFTPFELIYGRSVRGPLTVLRELWTTEQQVDETKTTFEYVLQLRERLDKTMKIAQDNLARASQRYRMYANRGKKMRKFEVGDSVLLLLPTDRNKLLMQWKGPYKVVEVANELDYVIEMNGNRKKFHANMMKKFIERADVMKDSGIATAREAAVCVVDGDESHSFDCSKAMNVEMPMLVGKETVEHVDINPELSDAQKLKLVKLVSEFKDVITDVPGKTDVLKHEIKLNTEVPIRSKAYPIPQAIKEEVKKEIDDMLEAGIIKESDSPYASGVVIVKKKDGTNRFCVDYRRINKVTVFDAEPMGNPDEVFNKLGKGKFFSKMDMAKGYWQIEVDPESQKYTAFRTEFGLHEFLRMPFGLVNSGATFTRMMRKVLRDIEGVENHVDDIIEYTETFEDHLTQMRVLLTRLRQHNLTVKPSKCKLGYANIEFLGHTLGGGVLGPSQDKVESIKDCKRPASKKEVRSFLGLVGYYRKFIANFSAKAAPLTDATKKGNPNQIEWSEALENAFLTLSNYLSKSPVLRLPDFGKDFVLRTDASATGIGAVLLQEEDGVKHPVQYASRKLKQGEVNYSTIEKECLALVWGVQKFEVYLYGRKFVLESDHQPLSYIDKARVANARVMRWALALQEYSFQVRHIRGSENVGADFLSRHPPMNV